MRCIRSFLALSLALIISCVWLAPTYVDASSADSDLIIVNKKTNKLAYFTGGKLEKVFPVATGKTPSLTPEGSFEIVNKIKNRPYYKEKIPGGDPKNPLGDRWIGLDVDGTNGTTYAIHGNNNKKSIGKYVSAGCIRMYNDDIHWLFPKIKLGTIAVVTTSSLSFEELAVKHGYSLGVQPFTGIMILDGKEIPLKQQMIISNSRIYIPLRACFELLGGTVLWDNKTQTATAKVGTRTITHVPLTKTATVNGKAYAIEPSLSINDTTMLPLKNMSELSGYTVQWDNKKKAIILTSPAQS
ncbi:hypothetical protein FHS18_005613 [Paenibacillus phyllosphaerae]|uniref:L,D-TPase catalytic domain-containing protein n=1 Tax=Paenibacillus phyllosphaerae TaxID=274593 RepID=A0A7W5FQJ1_9BACL|nr:L,D-transpeptidase family protein [Paenibacillus phyllosphaerae]MBB3113501.1 hypothetical protein [Paenibacillus phyllosphaerae]